MTVSHLEYFAATLHFWRWWKSSIELISWPIFINLIKKATMKQQYDCEPFRIFIWVQVWSEHFCKYSANKVKCRMDTSNEWLILTKKLQYHRPNFFGEALSREMVLTDTYSCMYTVCNQKLKAMISNNLENDNKID